MELHLQFERIPFLVGFESLPLASTKPTELSPQYETVIICVYVRFACLRAHGVVALLFYVHGKHLRSCRDGQLT